MAEATADTLLNEGDLQPALKYYQKIHRRHILAHHLLIADFSRRVDFSWLEKLFLKASPKDPLITRHILAIGHRLITVGQFLDPRMIIRAVWVNLKSLGFLPFNKI